MADNGTQVALMRAGGGVQAIVPQSFEEAWRVAGALFASGLAPKDINTQEKVLAVIMAGAEIGMPPFQALQSFAVINGRPALWGDGMLATVRKFGVKVEEKIDGTGDDAIAICHVTRPDTGELISRAFSVADAKKAGLWSKPGPWSQYPKRMLQMRARAWALRDGCADMLRGMKMAEEVQDYTEVVSSEPLPSDDMDQRTAEEQAEVGEGGFIGGELATLLTAHLTAQFDACATPEDVDKVLASFKRKYRSKSHRVRASDNYAHGVEEMRERAIMRLRGADGVADAIKAFSDLGDLEEWWARETTVFAVAALPEEQQARVTAIYEEAQERLADAIHTELAEQRRNAGQIVSK